MVDTHYQVIGDEIAFKTFIDWLPPLASHEKQYVALLGRNKYTTGMTHIKTDKAQLARFTSTNERLFEKIEQCEVPYGAYSQKGKSIPQEALALYMTINPRSERKACGILMKRLTDAFIDGVVNLNPYQESLSAMHKAISRKIYSMFDIDSKEDSIWDISSEVRSVIGDADFVVIETRGGYHVLIKASQIQSPYNKTWFQEMLKFKNLDITQKKDGKFNTDLMSPVPGCFQGGFIVKFHNFEKRF